MRRALAAILRALSRLVDPAPSEIVLDRVVLDDRTGTFPHDVTPFVQEYDGKAIARALAKYDRSRGFTPRP